MMPISITPLQTVYGSPQVPDTHQRFKRTQMFGVVSASWALLVAVGGCLTCKVPPVTRLASLFLVTHKATQASQQALHVGLLPACLLAGKRDHLTWPAAGAAGSCALWVRFPSPVYSVCNQGMWGYDLFSLQPGHVGL